MVAAWLIAALLLLPSLVIAALVAGVSMLSGIERRRSGCGRCGYPVVHSSRVCPECGLEYAGEEGAKTARGRYASRQGTSALSLMLSVCLPSTLMLGVSLGSLISPSMLSRLAALSESIDFSMGNSVVVNALTAACITPIARFALRHGRVWLWPAAACYAGGVLLHVRLFMYLALST